MKGRLFRLCYRLQKGEDQESVILNRLHGKFQEYTLFPAIA